MSLGLVDARWNRQEIRAEMKNPRGPASWPVGGLRGYDSRDLIHRSRRKGHIGENFRDVRIVVAVAVPRPAGAWVQHFAVPSDLLEARAVDAPDVAVLGR